MVVVPPIDVLRAAAMNAEAAEHFEQADRLYDRMLGVARSFYSNFPRQLAPVLIEVAEYCHTRQRDQEAISLLEEALAIFKGEMGEDCCCVGLVLARLAQVHKNNGDQLIADRLLKEVEAIAVLDRAENA